MTAEKHIGRYSGAMTVQAAVPFRFSVVHGTDPSRKSSQRKAVTKSISLNGLIFEIDQVEVDGFHISFTEASFGRNFLEISLELGKKWQTVKVLGQVEWYEARSTPRGHIFIVGVSFVEIQPDVMVMLREFLRSIHQLSR